MIIRRWGVDQDQHGDATVFHTFRRHSELATVFAAVPDLLMKLRRRPLSPVYLAHVDLGQRPICE